MAFRDFERDGAAGRTWGQEFLSQPAKVYTGWKPKLEFKLPLTGLTPSVAYRVTLRVHDALGAGHPYGWVDFGGFTLVPERRRVDAAGGGNPPAGRAYRLGKAPSGWSFLQGVP